MSSSSALSHNDDDDDDDDEDDDDDGRSKLRCDGCTTPILQEKKQKSSSSNYYYMSCDECKFFLHLACFNLPPELPYLPLHPIKDHKLTLRNSDKLTDWPYCSVCTLDMNGLIYACTKCDFIADIKCASLPDAIKHAGHPQLQHYLKMVTDNKELSICGACYTLLYDGKMFYRCHSCKFCVCCECVLLPTRNKHVLEKHWLPLTYDAYANHPSAFYCGSCEQKMNPKSWMYHCRDCDESFHPNCFPTTSGKYKNINFGRHQYLIASCHHHPLRFQLITKKKRCDLCHALVYEQPGFQCASCNFVMCFYKCGIQLIGAFKAID